MKKMLCAIGLAVMCSFSIIFADNLTVTFASKNISTGTYSPERDVVVFILNSSSAFVRTVAAWGGDRKDIATWSRKSLSVVDAVTSATVSGASADLSAAWDGNDVNKQPVANGTYWLCIDGTASDTNSAAPRLRIKILLDGTSKTITAADSSLDGGSTYFTNLSVAVTGSNAAVLDRNNGSPASHRFLSFGKTNIPFPLTEDKTVMVHVYSLNGTALTKRAITLGAPGSVALFPIQRLTPGMYVLKINSGSWAIEQKAFIGN